MSFNPWVMFVIGLILGWLITWLISRSRSKKLQAEVAALNARLQHTSADLAETQNQLSLLQSSAAADAQRLNADLTAASDKLAVTETTAARVPELDAQLQACGAAREALQQQLAAAQEDAAQRIGALEAAAAAGAADLAAAQTRAQQLEAQVAELGSSLRAAQAAPSKVGEIAERAATIDLTQDAVVTASGEGDDFTQIRGIGPAFASRLAASGIRRYSDLAAADPDELVVALGVKEWQHVDTRDWVAQAGALAARPRRVQVGDDLTRLEGIGPAYAQRLRAAGITSFAQLAATDGATLAEIIAAPAWRQPNFGDWVAQAKLAATGDEAGLRTLQDVLFSRKGDNLALIEGLGDAGVEALEIGGITSFAALSHASPEQLDDLFGKAGVRGGNFAGWIAEAKLRAAGKRIARPRSRERTRSAVLQGAQLRSCPQDLEQVQGIGPVYEQRLYAVGIGTFWEVGMVTQEELKSILEVQEFQDVDLDAIQTDALRLARETEAMGQTWDGSEPDDFDELEGIGPVLERRLYAAGICTYEDLANTPRERLIEICKAPAFNQPDYDHWIAVAKARARAGNA